MRVVGFVVDSMAEGYWECLSSVLLLIRWRRGRENARRRFCCLVFVVD